jgi:hypothetical protein
MTAGMLPRIEAELQACWRERWEVFRQGLRPLLAQPVDEPAGGFLLVEQGVTIAVRHDTYRQRAGYFADLGCVPAGDEARVLRELLALNGSAAHAQVRFGLHPASGRAVAAQHQPLALVARRPDLAHEALLRLAATARTVRIGG